MQYRISNESLGLFVARCTATKLFQQEQEPYHERGVFLNQEPQTKVRLPQKEKGEVLGIIESMLGANRMKIRAMDGKTRVGEIRGRMKNHVWLRIGDVIVMVPWTFQDDKADIVRLCQGMQAE